MIEYFKSFFNTDIYTPAKDLVDQYLKLIRLNSPAELPPLYESMMKDASLKAENTDQFLKELVVRLPQQKVHAHILKMLNIIHVFAIERQYIREEIQWLEDMDFHFVMEQFSDKWFADFCLAYISYLIKLPSLSDIYRYLEVKVPQIEPSLHLTYLFRLTNHIRVLLTPTLNAVNVIGRYNSTDFPQMRELYKVLSNQLVKIYNLIKFLSDQILRQYRVYNPTQLKCFIRSLPQMQLTCDKVEDVLVNKYIKGKKNNCKIEFKQEKVAEVLYYLQYEYNGPEESFNKEFQINSSINLATNIKKVKVRSQEK